LSSAPQSPILIATVAGKGGEKATYALASTKDYMWKHVAPSRQRFVIKTGREASVSSGSSVS
jgi:hypothetical protein